MEGLPDAEVESTPAARPRAFSSLSSPPLALLNEEVECVASHFVVCGLEL